MAFGGVLFADRQVRLEVAVVAAVPSGRVVSAGLGFLVVVVGLAAALVHEVLRQIQVAALAGVAIELDQRQLELLVAGVAPLLALAVAELLPDVVGVAAKGGKQGVVAGGFLVGEGGLDEVAGAVELVPIAQVGPALLRLDDGEVDVKVAVRLLRPRDQRDYFGQIGRQGRIGVGGKAVGGRLHPLGHVGVPEDVGRVGHSGPPVEAEGVYPAGVAQVLDLDGKGDAPGGLLAGSPEGVAEGDLGERHRMQAGTHGAS